MLWLKGMNGLVKRTSCSCLVVWQRRQLLLSGAHPAPKVLWWAPSQVFSPLFPDVHGNREFRTNLPCNTKDWFIAVSPRVCDGR